MLPCVALESTKTNALGCPSTVTNVTHAVIRLSSTPHSPFSPPATVSPRYRPLLALLLALATLSGPLATYAAVTARGAPLLEGLEPYRLALASSNATAQRYFAQGVVLTWGFNRAEAARSFETAATVDPGCALCWWGLAWSLGPNINADLNPADGARVATALGRARETARTRRERELVEALAARHPDSTNPEQVDEAAYAARTQDLARRYPRDPELAVLAAEAILNLRPYDWWDANGTARASTTKALALLDRAIAIEPRHAGAHHYRIHVYESSSQPEKARDSAERLRTLVPGSGHLLHMPAHIDMRTGRYEAAVRANQAAIEADRRYLAQLDAQGAYRVGYVAHNRHFLWAAAAMDGRGELALAAARDAWPAACGPANKDLGSAILQHYYVLPLFALVRFGHWDAIVADTLPPDVAEPYPQAIWHYARGTAWARKGRVEEARRELAALEKAAKDPALGRARIKNINSTEALVRIAVLTLQADIASAEGDTAEALRLLTEATNIEDAFAYDEPHLWLAPTRHALGVALLAANRPDAAERVYREDLRHYPDNPWSLAGLSDSLQRQGKEAAAADAKRRLAAASARADAKISASRF